LARLLLLGLLLSLLLLQGHGVKLGRDFGFWHRSRSFREAFELKLDLWVLRAGRRLPRGWGWHILLLLLLLFRLLLLLVLVLVLALVLVTYRLLLL
jgi:hypothetical protein